MSEITMKITRETDDESEDIEITVQYEGNATVGIRADRYGAPVNGDPAILLTADERERAGDLAWQDFGEEMING